eukprot:gnl/MRDRNA2_/MRDRNA2_110197_c0_seq1.p1 gnl/MRDRNA2_/MRDRNA2_110197_c0~~gnl/MRDRNA2_/MRDRNA2_110197_c0_seq1.p1  ORF type:complete len:217 (-),score=42.73 gnl/MRDRNA2_/MRDRNA2_110197_c0_seq1:26-583(-)
MPGLVAPLGNIQMGDFVAAPSTDQSNITQQMNRLSMELASLQNNCSNNYHRDEKNDIAQQMLRLTRVIEDLHAQVRTKLGTLPLQPPPLQPPAIPGLPPPPGVQQPSLGPAFGPKMQPPVVWQPPAPGGGQVAPTPGFQAAPTSFANQSFPPVSHSFGPAQSFATVYSKPDYAALPQYGGTQLDF